MSQMSPTLTTRPRMLTKKSTTDRNVTSDEFFVGDTSVDPEFIGACGLPVEPLEPAVIRQWESEAATEQSVVSPVIGAPRVDGAGQAELSGFDDDEDVSGDVPADDSDDDEFDDFDDIDEDDFDDDFDDDFEEELDDDYEIEIEDEISAEFGLSGVEVDIEDIEAIDVIDVIDVIDDDIVIDDDTPEKE